MINNNLCDFCRYKNCSPFRNDDEICEKILDFRRPNCQRVVSCNLFECLPFAYSDVVYKNFVYPELFVEIGLVAPRTFKRERNKNQYVL